MDLDATLMRLALTESEAALGVSLTSILPGCLSELARHGPGTPVFQKAFACLSHILKRVKDRPSVPLPVRPLLAALHACSPHALPFYGMWLKLGFGRLSAEELNSEQESSISNAAEMERGGALLPCSLFSNLLQAWPTAPAAVKGTLQQLLLQLLPKVSIPGDADARVRKFSAITSSAALQQLLLQLALDTLLLQKKAAAAAPAPAATVPGTSTAAPSPLQPPAGLTEQTLLRYFDLSPSALAAAAAATAPGSTGSCPLALALEQLAALPAQTLLERKLAWFKLLPAAGLPESELLPLALAGACDPHHSIAEAGDALLKRLSGVNLEDELLQHRLAELVCGSQALQQAGVSATAAGAGAVAEAATAASLPRSPAPAAVKSKALQYLARSRTAAARLPMAFLLFSATALPPPAEAGTALSGAAQLKMQQEALRFACLTFQLATPAAVEPFGRRYLQLLLQLLQSLSSSSSSTAGGPVPAAGAGTGLLGGPFAPGAVSASITAAAAALQAGQKDSLRETLYSAFGGLALKAPAIFRDNTALPALLFARFSSEPQQMRLAIAESLSSFASVYSCHPQPPLLQPSGSAAEAAAPATGTAAASISFSAGTAVSPAVQEKLLDILEKLTLSPASDVRLLQTVLLWLKSVFPFNSVRARYLCLLLCGSSSLELRAGAWEGLKPRIRPQQQPQEASTTSSSSSSDSRGLEAEADSTKSFSLAKHIQPLAAASVAEQYPSQLGEVLGFLVYDRSSLELMGSADRSLAASAAAVATAACSSDSGNFRVDSSTKKMRLDGSSSDAALAHECSSTSAAGTWCLSSAVQAELQQTAGPLAFSPRFAQYTAPALAATAFFLFSCLQAAAARQGCSLSAYLRQGLTGQPAAVVENAATEVLPFPPPATFARQLAGLSSFLEHCCFRLDAAMPELGTAQDTAAVLLRRLLQAAPLAFAASSAAAAEQLLRKLRSPSTSLLQHKCLAEALFCAALLPPSSGAGTVAAAGKQLPLGGSPAQVLVQQLQAVHAGTEGSIRLLAQRRGALLALGRLLQVLGQQAAASSAAATVSNMEVEAAAAISAAATAASGQSSAVTSLSLTWHAALDLLVRDLSSKEAIVREGAAEALANSMKPMPALAGVGEAGTTGGAASGLPLPEGSGAGLAAALCAAGTSTASGGSMPALQQLVAAVQGLGAVDATPLAGTNIGTVALSKQQLVQKLIAAMRTPSDAASTAWATALASGEVGSEAAGGSAEAGDTAAGGAAAPRVRFSESPAEAASAAAAKAAGESGRSTSGGNPAELAVRNQRNSTACAVAACLGAFIGTELQSQRQGSSAAAPSTVSALPLSLQLALAALLSLSKNASEQVMLAAADALLVACSPAIAAFTDSRSSVAAGSSLGSGSREDSLALLSLEEDLSSAGSLDDVQRKGLQSGLTSLQLLQPLNAGAALQLPAKRQAAAGLATQEGPPSAPLLAAEVLRSAVLQYLLDDCLSSIYPQQRSAAGVWLVTLLHGLGDAAVSPVMHAQLPALQAAFTRLLNEREQLLQETAGRGLALVFHHADAKQRSGLLAGLLEAFKSGKKQTGMGGGAAAASSAVSTGAAAGAEAAADAVVHAEAASSSPTPASSSLPSAPRGPASMALSASGEAAYRELCSMANEAGQPELIYQFLALAGHQSRWHARGGASYGLEALLQTEARELIAPHLGELIPRLFRYQYDPHGRVKDSMTRLWQALVPDPARAVEQHFSAIVIELVRASAGEQWREREAALLAAADILGGRGEDQLGPCLLQLWRACLRAIDDVKDSVRAAASLLLKGLDRATLRLSNPEQTSPSASRRIVNDLLPFLLEEGLSHPIKEAQSVSLQLLHAVSKASGALLRPWLAQLAGAALQGFSAYENEGMSYLQTHANAGSAMYGEGLSQERLESIRLAATRSGPLHDLLEACIGQLRSMSLVELNGPGVLLTAAAEVAGEGRKEEGAGMIRNPGKGKAAGSAAGSSEGEGGALRPFCDKVRQIITGGIGLPSRGAAARLVSTLVYNLGDAMKPQAMLLMRCLQAALEDGSPTLRKEFGSAAGALARVCKTGTLQKYVERLLSLAGSPGGSGGGEEGTAGGGVRQAEQRLTAGHAVRELFKQAGERAKAHLGELVPAAFLGCQDSDQACKTAWADAWAEMAPSPKATLQLFSAELAAAVLTALDSSGWEAKRQGAAALTGLVLCLGEVGDFAAVGSAAAVGGAAGASIGGVLGLQLPLLPLSDLPLPGSAQAAAVEAVAAKMKGEGTMKNEAKVRGEGAGSGLARSLLLEQRQLLSSAGAGTSSNVGSAADEGSTGSSFSASSSGRSSSSSSASLSLAPHAVALFQKLTAGISGGRVWQGKEALLEAYGLLCCSCSNELFPPANSQAAWAAGWQLQLLTSGGAAAAATTAAAPERATTAGGNSSSRSPTAAGSPLHTCLALLLQQAQRGSSPAGYCLAAVRAAAAVLGAVPGRVNAYAAVSAVAQAVLKSRCGALRAAAVGSAGASGSDVVAGNCGGVLPVAAAGTGSEASSSSLRGGRPNEEKEGEDRDAAKQAELEQSLLASACYGMLAAAVPPALMPLQPSWQAGGSSSSDVAVGSEERPELILLPLGSSGVALPVLSVATAAAAALAAVVPACTAALEDGLQLLLACLQAASLFQERITLLKCLGLLLAKTAAPLLSLEASSMLTDTSPDLTLLPAAVSNSLQNAFLVVMGRDSGITAPGHARPMQERQAAAFALLAILQRLLCLQEGEKVLATKRSSSSGNGILAGLLADLRAAVVEAAAGGVGMTSSAAAPPAAAAGRALALLPAQELEQLQKLLTALQS